jgi:hypothetical protein
VRAATLDDSTALMDLYASLSEADLWHRFFGVLHPGRSFVERWIGISDRGGLLLVAALSTVDPEPDRPLGIVGDCGYALLPTGDGELGLCVDPAWRGWLAPYLLDCLLREAADRGVPTIAADILWENRPMLALARRRGATHLPSDDPAVVRVVMPTGPRDSTSPAVRP